MWTSLSAGRWMCLLTLAVVMFPPASQGNSIAFDCCEKDGKIREVKDIQHCFEQKSQEGCQYHYYRMVTSSNRRGICVHPDVPWLKKLLDTGDLTCNSLFPILSAKERFEVLDKYDME